MQKIKIFLIFVCLLTLSVGSSESQTTEKKFSKKEKKQKLLEVNKSGCPWVGATTFEHNKPSDLTGFIVYGFRGLFGRNKKLIVDYNCQPKIEKLIFSQIEITANCEITTSIDKICFNKNQSIEVTTVATDPENDVLTYEYKISGGKVVGAGSKIVWDLSGVKPAVYTISACVDDGSGCVGTLTNEVKIIECPDCK